MDEGSRDTAADAVYTWTVRVLYTALIAANLWYFLEMYHDTPEAQRLITRAERLAKKATRPWRERKHFNRAFAETIVDAEVTLKMADKEKP